jgi:hypothetical protein
VFCSYRAELTVFNRKVFTLFDDDCSGEINVCIMIYRCQDWLMIRYSAGGCMQFLEFVCSNWNFLTLKKEDMGVMAFMMCDKTGLSP